MAAYRSGSVLVSMREDAGSCVGLLEAMAAELPVLAYAAAPCRRRSAGPGLAFDEKRFALLAEVAVRLGRTRDSERGCWRGQRRRLEAAGPERSEERLSVALESVGVQRPRRTRRTPRRRPRVGIVVQRYGPGITGGAEAHAAQVVARLLARWDIRVLTSCAVDHLTWANALPAGETRVDGVPVLRFANPRPRPMPGA